MELLQTINESVQGLKLTREMYRQARGNKQHVIVSMRPEDFLKLTTPNDERIDEIRQDCKKLNDYNRWAEEGESILMPFIDVNGETGKIKSHEGRHRASALVCAGSTEMPVSIKISPTDEHKKKYGYFEATYEMKFEDLPEYLHGQYGRGIINKSELRVLVDGWENLRK